MMHCIALLEKDEACQRAQSKAQAEYRDLVAPYSKGCGKASYRVLTKTSGFTEAKSVHSPGWEKREAAVKLVKAAF